MRPTTSPPVLTEQDIPAMALRLAGAGLLLPDHVRLVQALLASGARPQAQAVLAHAAQLPCQDLAILEAMGFHAFGLGVHAAAKGFTSAPR